MRPSSGVSMPAMQRRVRLLPQPDAPRNPSVSSPAENDTSSVNALKSFLISTSRLMRYSSEPRRYLVVRLPHRLMNRMTTKLNTITTPVQNSAASMSPPIHSK